VTLGLSQITGYIFTIYVHEGVVKKIGTFFQETHREEGVCFGEEGSGLEELVGLGNYMR